MQGRNPWCNAVDPAPRQIPAPESIQRALDVLASAQRPLIILGKGAAYAQADADIRSFIEKTGIPYLPMSMAKGLLPDNHPQSAAAARSLVLAQADVVMLIGARLNWLLAHGKAATLVSQPRVSCRSIFLQQRWIATAPSPRRSSAISGQPCPHSWPRSSLERSSRKPLGSKRSGSASSTMSTAWQPASMPTPAR